MKFVSTLVLSICLLAASVAGAKEFKVIVGTAAGSGSDTMTRKIFSEVAKNTSDTFTVINKPGNGTLIAYQFFLEESKQNSNVILLTAMPFYTASYITKEANYDPFNELKLLTPALKTQFVGYVRVESNINSPADIKGKLNVGHASSHVAAVFPKLFPDQQLVSVMYKSDVEVMFALMKGEIDVASVQNSTVFSLAKGNKDKVRQVNIYPRGVGSVHGYSVPPSLPETETKKLRDAINSVLDNDDFNKWMMETSGAKPEGGGAEHFLKLINSSLSDTRAILSK